MKGKIIKGISGFYFVNVPGQGIYECKARGIFRKKEIRPLIGDNVEITLVNEKKKIGNVSKILPRINHLDRPAVANLDQMVIVFSLRQPDPNLTLLDGFLVMLEARNIEAIICFNKTDLLQDGEIDELISMYSRIGYDVVGTSFAEVSGIDQLKQLLFEKTSVFAGPSGVGKSSILNLIQEETVLETGTISQKIGRGRHTTRHVELICFDENSYVVDTPGFSALSLEDIEADNLKYLFKEFYNYEPDCKYKGCNHLNEPQCGIKDAVAEGKISENRYLSYTFMMEELSTRKPS